MSVAYIPHVTKVRVVIQIEGHQLYAHSRDITLTKNDHGGEVVSQLADALLSIVDLAIAKGGEKP